MRWKNWTIGIGRVVAKKHDARAPIQPRASQESRCRLPLSIAGYVVVHEMIHLIEPTHSERFLSLMTEHYPAWREARAELNELPLTAEVWNE